MTELWLVLALGSLPGLATLALYVAMEKDRR